VSEPVPSGDRPAPGELLACRSAEKKGALPWAKLRQGQKLLRLGQKYGWSRLERAAERALAFEVIDGRAKVRPVLELFT
jgi:hypothetical protein